VRAALAAMVTALCLAAAAAAAAAPGSAVPTRPADLAIATSSRPAPAAVVRRPNCHGRTARSAGFGSAIADQVAATRAGERTALSAGSLRSPRVEVSVFAHVLRTPAHGGVPQSRIRSQLHVLNAAFAGRESPYAARSPFHFRLAGVDVSANRAWYRMDEGTLAEQHAKRALHRGTAEDLNLYIGANAAGVLGWGTQPTAYPAQPRLDGVVIARHTLPGGRWGRYSSGDDAVHETGHWLGLYHTFEGGCSRRGDRVADTPAEARPSYTCHLERDTCASPGNDPVHNFMDYGDDACMNAFTAGQVDRMVDQWSRLRSVGRAT
jgi:Pregnancy-associated plasma protein-A